MGLLFRRQDPDTGIDRHLDQRKRRADRQKQHFGGPETAQNRHRQTGQQYHPQADHHRTPVSQPWQKGRDQKGHHCNGNILEPFQQRRALLGDAEAVDGLQDHHSDTVQQQTEQKVVEHQYQNNQAFIHCYEPSNAPRKTPAWT